MYASAKLTTSLRSRRPALRTKTRAAVSPSRDTRFRGAAVEIWKQLSLLRRANGRQILVGTAGGGALLGAAAAFVYARDPAIGITLLGTVLAAVLLTLATRGVSLRSDLSKPLWWFGDGSTTAKLGAWAFGSSVLPGMFVSAGAVVMTLVLRSLDLFVASLVAAWVFPVSIRSIGALAYVVVPSSVDQRGPGAALRMLLLYVFLVPPVASAIAAEFFFHSAAAAWLVAGGVAALECSGALWLCGLRIDGRGVEFAVAERS